MITQLKRLRAEVESDSRSWTVSIIDQLVSMLTCDQLQLVINVSDHPAASDNQFVWFNDFVFSVLTCLAWAFQREVPFLTSPQANFHLVVLLHRTVLMPIWPLSLHLFPPENTLQLYFSHIYRCMRVITWFLSARGRARRGWPGVYRTMIDPLPL